MFGRDQGLEPEFFGVTLARFKGAGECEPGGDLAWCQIERS